jgi:molecular chaperone GrpE
MTNKKANTSEAEQDQAVTPDEVLDPETAEELEEQISEDLEELDELAQAKAETEELRDHYIRLKAEWDNYRKRTESERASERSRATQRLVEKLLPVVDDLERAIIHADNNSIEQSVIDGIIAVSNKLGDILKSEGLQTINPEGERFDANLHSAISKVDDDTINDETVVQVFQKGYEMGGRVLRPAMVVVSAGGPPYPTK